MDCGWASMVKVRSEDSPIFCSFSFISAVRASAFCRIVSMSSSVMVASLLAKISLAPCRIIEIISSLPSVFCASASRP